MTLKPPAGRPASRIEMSGKFCAALSTPPAPYDSISPGRILELMDQHPINEILRSLPMLARLLLSFGLAFSLLACAALSASERQPIPPAKVDAPRAHAAAKQT